jgi:CBS-domain-containing membrane protein
MMLIKAPVLPQPVLWTFGRLARRSTCIPHWGAGAIREQKGTKAMKARDIMTRDVVTVGPNASVHEVATLLATHHISGIPVTAADKRLLGIVSEGDLVERVEVGGEPKGKWWLEGFGNTQALASRYAKAHGATVADVMTRQVATVHPDADLEDVADIFQAHRVKRVPVVQDGRLLGIVTRSDIVKAVSGAMGPAAAKMRTDGELQRAILERMRVERWLDTSYVNCSVSKGKVTVGGLIGSAEERRGLRTLVEEVAGPDSVIDQLEIGLPVVSEF